LATLRLSLSETLVAGVATNISWLIDLLDLPETQRGQATTQTAGAVSPRVPDRAPALLAAVARTLDGGRAVARDPWSAIGPFRLSGESSLVFHGDDWEDRMTVRRRGDGWEVDSGAGPVPLRWWRDAAGVWTVVAGAEGARLAVIEHDGGMEIAGAGGRWVVRAGGLRVAGLSERSRAGDDRVRAPMPGRILAIHATAGDRVAAGQPLVTLGAMKMELACEAPAAGTVARVACSVDGLVGANDVLVELSLESTGGNGA
ncbi:MAG: biotin/lipoyl-containing protein, partial [Actinomycetes bacterium]